MPPRATRCVPAASGDRRRGRPFEFGCCAPGEAVVADRRQVDQHVGGRPAGSGSAQPGCDLEVTRRVEVARPASHSIESISRAHSRTTASGASVAGARPPHGGIAGACSSAVSLGRWRAATNAPYAARPRRPGRAASPCAVGDLERVFVVARNCSYLGRSSERRLTIASRLAASAAATADALPPPGTGSSEASRSTNSLSVRSLRLGPAIVAIVAPRRSRNADVNLRVCHTHRLGSSGSGRRLSPRRPRSPRSRATRRCRHRGSRAKRASTSWARANRRPAVRPLRVPPRRDPRPDLQAR